MVERVDKVLDLIKEMTILEVRDLNQRLQDEFGITAAAPSPRPPLPPLPELPRPLLRPRRRRPSGRLGSRTLAPTRSTSSRPSGR
jgi:hypothetical protein